MVIAATIPIMPRVINTSANVKPFAKTGRNIPLDTINMIKREVGNPKLCTIVSIAKTLNVDLNTLLPL